jgi:hypothetical protein
MLWRTGCVYFLIIWILCTVWLLCVALRSAPVLQRRPPLALHDRLPTRYTYQTNDDVSCSVCYFPTVCLFGRTAYMPAVAAHAAQSFAQNYQCGLTCNRAQPVDNCTMHFGEGLQLRFDRDLANFSTQPLDVLNLAEGNPVDIGYTTSSDMTHFPHYLERTFLDVWRMLSYLENMHRSRPFARRFQDENGSPNPTILTHDSIRRSERDWFVGFHTVMQLIYDSIIFQDLSRWSRLDTMCYRSALVHRCDGPSSAFMAVFRQLLKQSLGVSQDPLFSQSVVRVGYLSRLKNRVINDIDAIVSNSTSMAAVNGLELVSRTLLFEKLSYGEQVRELSQTDILVAAHGAGLANLLFMPAHSHVIEITPFAFKPFYDWLSHEGGIAYHWVESQAEVRKMAECAKRNGNDEFAALYANISQDGIRRPSVQSTLGRRDCFRQQNLTVDVQPLATNISQIAFNFVRKRSSAKGVKL